MECNLGPIKVRGQNRRKRKKENINKQIFLFIPYSTFLVYIVYSLVAIRLRKKLPMRKNLDKTN